MFSVPKLASGFVIFIRNKVKYYGSSYGYAQKTRKIKKGENTYKTPLNITHSNEDLYKYNYLNFLKEEGAEEFGYKKMETTFEKESQVNPDANFFNEQSPVSDIASGLNFTREYFQEILPEIMRTTKKWLDDLKEVTDIKAEDQFQLSSDYVLGLGGEGHEDDIGRDAFLKILSNSSVAKNFPQLFEKLARTIDYLLKLQDTTLDQIYSCGVHTTSSLNHVNKKMGLYNMLADSIHKFTKQYLKTGALYEANALQRSQLLCVGGVLFFAIREGTKTFICMNGIELKAVVEEAHEHNDKVTTHEINQVVELIINAPEMAKENFFFVEVINGKSVSIPIYNILFQLAAAEKYLCLENHKLSYEERGYIEGLEKDELINWYRLKKSREYLNKVKNKEFFEQAQDNVHREKITEYLIKNGQLQSEKDIKTAFKYLAKVKNPTRKAETAIEILAATCNMFVAEELKDHIDIKYHKDINIILGLTTPDAENYLHKIEESALHIANKMISKEFELSAEQNKSIKTTLKKVLKVIEALPSGRTRDSIYGTVSLSLLKIEKNLTSLGVNKKACSLFSEIAEELSNKIEDTEIRDMSKKLDWFEIDRFQPRCNPFEGIL